MRTQHLGFTTKLKMATAGLAASAVFALGLGLGAAAPAGASESKFCTAILKFESVTAPAPGVSKSYKAWVKKYLPAYENLAAEAPNAKVKTVLTQLVTILKYEENVTAASKLESYIAKNTKQWAADWQAFAKAAVACVTSGVTLP